MKSYFDNQPFLSIPEVESVPNVQQQPGSPTLSAGAHLIGAVCTLGSPDLQGLGESDNTWRQLGNSGVDREVRNMVDAEKHPLSRPDFAREDFEQNDAPAGGEGEAAGEVAKVAGSLLGSRSSGLGSGSGQNPDPMKKPVEALEGGLGLATGAANLVGRLISPDGRRK